MTIDTLVKEGRERTHIGLAGIDTQRLKAIRNASLRACFNRMEETRYRLEFVARVRGRVYINDAAARSVNSTWYSLERLPMHPPLPPTTAGCCLRRCAR